MAPARQRIMVLMTIAVGAGGIAAFEGCGSTYTTAQTPDASLSDAIAVAMDAGAGDDGAAQTDAATDAPAAPTCDLTKPFGPPMPFDDLPALSDTGLVRLSADELEVYTGYGDGGPDEILMVATRTSTSQPFGALVELANVNVAAKQGHPSPSADDLALYFDVSSTPHAVQVATRNARAAPFGAPTAVTALNGSGNNSSPSITNDGDEIFFTSDRNGGAGGQDLYHAVKIGGAFGAPVQLSELTTPTADDYAVISADKTTLYFASDRDGGAGALDIWIAKRANASAAFGAPVPVSELDTSGIEVPSWLSQDGCRLLIIRAGTTSQGGPGYIPLVATKPKP